MEPKEVEIAPIGPKETNYTPLREPQEQAPKNFTYLDVKKLSDAYDQTRLQSVRETLARLIRGPKEQKASRERLETPQFDALVVLSSMWEKHPSKDRLQLGREARKRILAAGSMYKAGLVSGEIIISGGKTAGKDQPSEASVLKQQLRILFPMIPEDKIILEENAISTRDNGKKVAEIIESRNLHNIGLLTSEAHLRRSKRVFKHFGIEVKQALSAERVFNARTSRHGEFVERYKDSAGAKSQRRIERILNATGILDRGDRIGHTFATLFRKGASTPVQNKA